MHLHLQLLEEWERIHTPLHLDPRSRWVAPEGNSFAATLTCPFLGCGTSVTTSLAMQGHVKSAGHPTKKQGEEKNWVCKGKWHFSTSQYLQHVTTNSHTHKKEKTKSVIIRDKTNQWWIRYKNLGVWKAVSTILECTWNEILHLWKLKTLQNLYNSKF